MSSTYVILETRLPKTKTKTFWGPIPINETGAFINKITEAFRADTSQIPGASVRLGTVESLPNGAIAIHHNKFAGFAVRNF